MFSIASAKMYLVLAITTVVASMHGCPSVDHSVHKDTNTKNFTIKKNNTKKVNKSDRTIIVDDKVHSVHTRTVVHTHYNEKGSVDHVDSVTDTYGTGTETHKQSEARGLTVNQESSGGSKVETRQEDTSSSLDTSRIASGLVLEPYLSTAIWTANGGTYLGLSLPIYRMSFQGLSVSALAGISLDTSDLGIGAILSKRLLPGVGLGVTATHEVFSNRNSLGVGVTFGF